MTPDAYRKYLVVRLDRPCRVRCCTAKPIPTDTVVVLFDRPSSNRVLAGLWFPGDYDPKDPPYHHMIIGFGESSLEEAQRTGRVFPEGGFCVHKVKLSGIHGSVVGEVSAEAQAKLERRE